MLEREMTKMKKVKAEHSVEKQGLKPWERKGWINGVHEPRMHHEHEQKLSGMGKCCEWVFGVLPQRLVASGH